MVTSTFAGMISPVRSSASTISMDSRCFLEPTGLDAALGIDEIPEKLELMVKGWRDPNDYFSLFRNSELMGKGSHTLLRNQVVTFFNDHDQVSKGEDKAHPHRHRVFADAGKDRGDRTDAQGNPA